MTEQPRIYLSPPHLGELEQQFVQEAFDTNWIAPLGPNVDAFERELAEVVGADHACALSSGTAGLHLALRILGVGEGDQVIVPSLTFVASVNPILYERAQPVFIDSEPTSWNLDPELLAQTIEDHIAEGSKPAAVMVVHLYGQCADMEPILEICGEHEIPIIEDAAEALGATYKGKAPGSFGAAGIFSFNGNKIITTSGGGMIVSPDEDFITRVRKLATQAREPAPHYEHTEVGFNYRLSNICAGVGRGQLRVLEDRVAARRANFEHYQRELGSLPGITFQPEAPWGMHSRWLTCLTVDEQAFGASREDIRLALEAQNIESRPTWKPMHLQPLYADRPMIGGEVCEEIFAHGLCLPSGSALTEADRQRVIEIVGSLAQ